MGKVLEVIKNSNLYIDDNPNASVDEIRSTCHKLMTDSRLDMLFVDYLQLMVVDENNAASEISHITKEFKKIGKEFGVPVGELSQLNVRDLKGGRPNLGSLKGSGSLEANADAVIFPWREYAVTREGDPSDMSLLIAKGRAFDSSDIAANFSTTTLSVTARSDYDYEDNGTERF
jgi:replicative DNA helicase